MTMRRILFQKAKNTSEWALDRVARVSQRIVEGYPLRDARKIRPLSFRFISLRQTSGIVWNVQDGQPCEALRALKSIHYACDVSAITRTTTQVLALFEVPQRYSSLV